MKHFWFGSAAGTVFAFVGVYLSMRAALQGRKRI